MAEREGFEPSVRSRRTTVFETAPFDRSGISPLGQSGFIARMTSFDNRGFQKTSKRTAAAVQNTGDPANLADRDADYPFFRLKGP